MSKSKLIVALTVATIAAATMFAPMQASARNGIKCGWVLTSSDPATGSYTYEWQCGVKGA